MKIKTVITDSRLGTEFPLPSLATTGSAAVDLRAMIDSSISLAPGEHRLVSSGMRIWVEDPSYAAFVLPRSGLGSKGLVIGNLVGLVDSDYQGDLKICLWNRSDTETFTVEPGDRVAQLLVMPVQQFSLEVVDSFDAATIRGENGFGHTGKV